MKPGDSKWAQSSQHVVGCTLLVSCGGGSGCVSVLPFLPPTALSFGGSPVHILPPKSSKAGLIPALSWEQGVIKQAVQPGPS